ncbi:MULTISPECIES: NAD(P)/FAD-dependent oxidoreductase [Pelosinus]|jgi:alkyl hydroperoxide reductase subunit F|uniref:Pyridine nucleotide-disulfide oxidoreductase, FAD/NAD(P)-binding domain-containing protein n=1 Tax=Pelosinus fermentans B4 TaxID=1149862 RepID=I9AYM7_9FIRM|nr:MULTISPECIES: FAD-dependent oxidoreductase [Pelosinus]EIW17992.1 Pyridine nucleotide-disulfide oxidoreductase, FAD/NAD(P)-binding domain-containing protein [Pelosinus fermentans B4]EIW23954.1 FAD-dependent pyridine nucleotide-disulfide oxidoreductase [Pelosinus fermentans A11]OAM94877.1 Thioredoxin-disulfide reductase [Pelosinus fermentans DSM 17108]SDR19498.1 alkyl hydroperoxide reductase subunit F [Pelosinus fermentans]
MYDLIIIGGGPAGLTAAVYAARKKMNTLLLTKEFGGQLMWTKEIENYMGYQFISGPELMGKFEEQVKRFAVAIQYEEVNGFVVNQDGTFLVKTEEKEYQSKTVILATGKRPRGLDIPGEKEFTGRGVSYCATCDGPFFDNKAVAVIGGGNSAVQAALELSKIAHNVYLVVRNDHYIADPIILEKMKAATNIIEKIGYESEGIYGNEVVEKITIREITTGKLQDLAIDGVFVEIGLEPNSEYIEDIVRMNKRKELMVDCRSRTNIPGVYAAGDITDGPDKQIVIAAGDGAKAALMAYDYLLHKE